MKIMSMFLKFEMAGVKFNLTADVDINIMKTV